MVFGNCSLTALHLFMRIMLLIGRLFQLHHHWKAPKGPKRKRNRCMMDHPHSYNSSGSLWPFKRATWMDVFKAVQLEQIFFLHGILGLFFDSDVPQPKWFKWASLKVLVRYEYVWMFGKGLGLPWFHSLSLSLISSVDLPKTRHSVTQAPQFPRSISIQYIYIYLYWRTNVYGAKRKDGNTMEYRYFNGDMLCLLRSIISVGFSTFQPHLSGSKET